MRRDITEQWQNITEWYWQQHYRKDHRCLSIWQILERDHGVKRTRSMSGPSWTQVDFPDEKAYVMFLLRWS